MENAIVVSEEELSDIIAVCRERGIEILYSVQDNAVRIESHFDEIQDILWAMGVLDGENALERHDIRAEVGSGVL